MIRVKTALGLLVVCAEFAIPLQTASAAPLNTYVTEAAMRAHIPPAWITAVMRAESQGDASAVSPKGAMGLMQIMPDTWRELRYALNLGADPYDPHDNITAGAAYLRWLHDRYGNAGFLAAYNAGPGRYEQLLTSGKMLPDETRKYVARVVRLLHGRRFDDLASLRQITGFRVMGMSGSWTKLQPPTVPERRPQERRIGAGSGPQQSIPIIADIAYPAAHEGPGKGGG